MSHQPLIIDDSNWRGVVADGKRDGQSCGAEPLSIAQDELTCAKPCGDGDEFPDIPEVEWKERIEEKTAKKTWPQDAYDRVNPVHKFQNGLNYCWIYSLAQDMEVLRAMLGLPYIELAPEGAGEDVRYRNVGNGVDRAIAFIAKYGLPRRSLVPAHSLDPSRWDSRWKTDRLNFIVDEYWDGRDDPWRRTVCGLLSDNPPFGGLSWWKHAVTFTKLVIVKGEIGAFTPNTHAKDASRILLGSRKVFDWGIFIPRTIKFYLGDEDQDDADESGTSGTVGGPIRDASALVRDARELIAALRNNGLHLDIRVRNQGN